MSKHPLCQKLLAFAGRSGAMGRVLEERRRQVEEKGYTTEHDDEHTNGELAVAAAYFLLPYEVDPDVCHALDGNVGLEVSSLSDLLGKFTFDVFRDDDPVAWLTPADARQARVDTLVTGLALGLAELERLLRQQEGAG